VLATAPLFAQLQSRPPVLQLSLKQAVEIALAPEGNTRVRLAEESLKQADAESKETRAALLPDFESYVQYENETNNIKAFGFNFSSFIPAALFPAGVPSIPSLLGPFDILDVRASVNQSVLDLSALRRYQATKVAIDAVKADNEGTRYPVTDR
jgi:hypothetical protein